MKIKFSNNFGTKILSVAIALILWFIVGNINDPVKTETFTSIPVEITNEDVLESINKVYEITEGDTVNVTVRGKESIVQKLTKDDFTATADLSKLSIVNAVPIDISVVSGSLSASEIAQVDLTLGRINTVKVEIEDRESTMLPVTVETTGEVADGYAIGSKTSSPNMIEVSGSASLIKRLKEIKIQVDVEGANEDVSSRQSVAFYDQNGDKVESTSIDCDIAAVDVKIELWKTKEIPVSMETTGEVADGYGISTFEYEPKTVTVAAAKDDLDKIDEFTLDPLDVSGQSKNIEKTITVDSASLPSGVIFPDNTIDIVATAVIEQIVSEKISLNADDIEVRGLEDGQKASFGGKTYTIQVESFASKLTNVDGTSFEPYVEVSEIDAETGRAPIHLTNPSGVTVTNNVTAKITVE
ncbi:MAG: CdaR family protein [Lachnospiraceae bacterium]|nr:CdaR family protein [Lachnospiraceae bacterium]